MPLPLTVSIGRALNGALMANRPNTVLVSDAFAAVDGTNFIGRTTDTGNKTWTRGGTAAAITANWNGNAQIADPISPNRTLWYVDAGVPNCNISVVNRNGAANSILFRYVDDNNYWYVTATGTGTPNILGTSLRKVTAGVDSYPADANAYGVVGASQGDVLEVYLNGATIVVARNGRVIYTFSDSFNAPATKHGLLGLFSDNSVFDNFQITTPHALVSDQLPVIIFDGDSITAGIYNDTANTYPAQATASSAYSGYRIINSGVGGQTIDRLSVDAATQIDQYYNAARGTNLLFVLASVNNFTAGDTAAAAYAKLVSYCQARQAVGWKVIVATLTGATVAAAGAGYAAWATTFNSSIRTNYATFADAYCDFAADSIMGITAAGAGAYFVDGLHPTAAGHAILGKYAWSLINYSLNAKAAPTVTSISPNTLGNSASGTVTITGSNFTLPLTVQIGATTLSTVTWNSPTSLTATVPDSITAGIYNVTVTNPFSQTGTLTSGFTVTQDAPIVSSITPASGANNTTTPVTITGKAFAAGATVTLGATSLTGVSVVNGTTITATVPSGISAAVYTLTVTNPDTRTGSLSSVFTVSAAFAPTDLTNLRLWLKADSLGLTDGAAVATWADSSGNSLDASQATGASQPIYKTAILNGKPVVRTNGTSQWVGRTGTALHSTAATVFVLNKTSASGGNVFHERRTTTGTPIFSIERSGNKYSTRVRNDASTLVDTTATIQSFLPNIVEAQWDGTTEYNYSDGDANGSASVSGTLTLDQYSIGASVQNTSASIFFTGDIAEVIVYNRALNSTERGQVEHYLYAKYFSAFDNFNKADSVSSLGTTNNGLTWAAYQQSGTTIPGISTNRAYLPTPNNANNGFMAVDTGKSDCTIRFSVPVYGALSTADDATLYFRVTDANNWLRLQQFNSTLRLQKCVAGVISTITLAGHVATANDIFSIVLSGSTINYGIDGTGTILSSTTDSFNATATIHGFGTGAATTMINNFMVY